MKVRLNNFVNKTNKGSYLEFYSLAACTDKDWKACVHETENIGVITSRRNIVFLLHFTSYLFAISWLKFHIVFDQIIKHNNSSTNCKRKLRLFLPSK